MTIKIWDLVDQDRRFALAASLAPRNAVAREAGFRPGKLPPPVEGALAGRLHCSAAEHR